MYTLNDPIYVAYSGLFVNQKGEIDLLALATAGFIRQLDTTTARFCLFLIIKLGSLSSASVYTRKPPTIINKYRLQANANTFARKAPITTIYIDNCDG